MGVIMFASACNPSTSSRDQPSTVRADTIATKKKPDLLLTDEKPTASVRMLSEADKTYIDWIIPDYPDVILLHEGSAETLNYTEQVYRYLKSKNASVRKKAITRKHADKARDKRLYIDDVGENWYEVFVFDAWK